MNIAVKLYVSMDVKPVGIPDGWPAETIPLGESVTLPSGSGWILMTEQELATQKASNQAAYDTWIAPIVAEQEATVQAKAATQSVLDAMDFGQGLIIEFSAMNSVSSLTSEQIMEVSQRLSGIQALLSTGALQTALDAIPYITVDALLPQEVLNYFSQKISGRLGL